MILFFCDVSHQMIHYECDIRSNPYLYINKSREDKIRLYNEENMRCRKRGKAIPQPASYSISTLEVAIHFETGMIFVPKKIY